MAGASAAGAETLAQAVQWAYQSNPTLLSRRASQRALDETYVQARAGWRPTLGAQVSASDTRDDLGSGQGAELLTDATGNLIAVGGGGSLAYNSSNATLQASQPLYTGGRVRAAVDAAQADVLAGRESLRDTETQLLQSVVQAFADVRATLDAIAVRRQNVAVLELEVEQAKAKLELGQGTRIDLAQATAQLANARAQQALAEGQLANSVAAYAAVVGRQPGELAAVDALPGLPTELDHAFAIAEAENPTLRRAFFSEQGARFRVAQARAEKRPSASATVSMGYTGQLAPLAADRYDRAVVGSVTISQPIYSGGMVSSQIRQALDRDEAARLDVDSSRRNVIQTVSRAWSGLQTAAAAVKANTAQVAAAQLAFEGLREQNQFGTASTLDLLIQQQQFRDAQLALIQARRDVVVAQGDVLAAVGRLSASVVAPGVTPYDPARAFERVDRSSRFPLEAIPAALDRLGGARP